MSSSNKRARRWKADVISSNGLSVYITNLPRLATIDSEASRALVYRLLLRGWFVAQDVKDEQIYNLPQLLHQK